MGSRHKMDFTTGSVTKKLIIFALPLVFTNFVQHLYSAADSAVVGRFVGKIALAAVGSTTSATALLTNLLVGLAAGAGIINANLLGAGKKTELRRSMHTGMMVGAVSGVLLAVIGILLSRPLMILLNCPENVIDLSVTYIRIIFCGTPGSIIYNFGSGILRTHGDSKRPMVIILTSGAVNVVLNLIFVIFLKLSVVGVALATIVSNYLSAFFVLRILFNPNGDYRLKIRELKLHKEETWNILRVGIPCGLNAAMFNISSAVVTAGVNSFGDTVIAASSASTSITSLLTQMITGFFTAVLSFSGQCYGAGKYKRIDQVAWISMGICVSIMSVFATVITLFPQMFIGIFNTDPGVIKIGSQKMVLMSWSFVFYAIADMYMACLRGMKKTLMPTLFNVFSVCIVRILWVLIVCPLNPTSYMLMFWCYPVSYFCNFLVIIPYYLYCRKKCFIPIEEVT